MAGYFCPTCCAEAECEVVRRPTKIDFRGKTYNAEEEFARCTVCSNEFDVFGLHDPLKEIHEQYRVEHAYPSAEEIKALRECMELSAQEFGTVLGIASFTVRCYERGTLLKERHAAALKILISQHQHLKKGDKAT